MTRPSGFDIDTYPEKKQTSHIFMSRDNASDWSKAPTKLGLYLPTRAGSDTYFL